MKNTDRFQIRNESVTLESLNYDKIENISYLNSDGEENKPRLLLHSCCGPCSTAVIENLLEDYNITVFFYNPNITEMDEYYARREAQLEVIEYFNRLASGENVVEFIEGKYNIDDFLDRVVGLEDEKEGGKRCDKCFRLRLEETARLAEKLEFDCFDTTLTVSPHKNYSVISTIGFDLAEKYSVKYLNGNYKKKDGFKRSIDLSRKIGLYRQNYCGCRFSIWDK